MPPFCSELGRTRLLVSSQSPSRSALPQALRKTRALTILRAEELSVFDNSLRILTAQAQPIHYLVVALNIRAFQVIQQTSALLDHFQQSTPRMIVLLMGFEMLCQPVNSVAQQGDLYLWGACIRLVSTEVRHYLFFGFFC